MQLNISKKIGYNCW